MGSKWMVRLPGMSSLWAQQETMPPNKKWSMIKEDTPPTVTPGFHEHVHTPPHTYDTYMQTGMSDAYTLKSK